ncbi:hypothetical protein [Amycolatopsis eburnea]|uniref:PE domain-containing protein n=1 Tax=Amycolatopsis eburnea TaxID=2267691 RepID=A0A427T2G0_9PSEU|nr:hypothetical protein [Amycolatopsis eburnea]RSD11946.1 hypothetical protein EIY87_34990 [Amycolatopsis eburnea]
MSGDIDGDTDAMREFSRNLLGSLEVDPVSPAARRKDAVPCAGGLGAPWCEDLTHEDNASTAALHQFIAQVEQGFALYSSFVHRTAADYVRADEQARNEFLAALDSDHGGPPATDSRLER